MHEHAPIGYSGLADPDAARRRRTSRALVAGAVVAGFFIAGLGVAFATASPSHSTRLLSSPAAVTPAQATTPNPTTPGAAPDPNGGPGRRFGHGHGGPFGGKLFGFGGFGHGFGPGGGIHGEFTVKKPDGSGYETVATQVGDVTAVSPSSITVKSEDGFSRTYSVDENTVVGSGRDGIGSVKTGDTVRIAGVVEGGNAKAAAVMDSTSLGNIAGHWGFPKHK